MKETMESYLAFDLFDLVTPDGVISQVVAQDHKEKEVVIKIHNISPAFIIL